jgi:PPM family protein phosphatase
MRESLIYGAATHTGLVRANNEDHYAIIDHEGSYPYALILADGLGGHQSGELASQIAVEYVAQRLAVEFSRGLEASEMSRQMVDILEKTNVKVYLGSLGSPDNHGMGTTLTLAVFLPDQLLVAHVGDCRAYLMRSGNLSQITIDHTLLQEMIEAGTATPGESGRNPRRNVLTRALGIPEYIHPDLMTVPVQRGDRILLCSDGLHGYVADSEIRSLMRKDKTPVLLTGHLIQLALEAGGEDNITVLAAYLQ